MPTVTVLSTLLRATGEKKFRRRATTIAKPAVRRNREGFRPSIFITDVTVSA